MATAEVDGARSSERSISLENKEEKFDNTENVGTDVDHHCQPCFTEDMTVKSSKFCVDCNEFLCKDCVRAHRKLNCTRHHQIVDKRDDISSRPVMTSAGVCCFYHSDKQLDQFCEQHDECCCVSCLNTRHRACKAKSTIYEVSSKLSEEEINDVEEKIQKVIVKLNEVKATRSKDVDLLVTQRQHTLNSLGSIKLDLQNVFEQLYQKHTETVERKCVKLRGKLENDIQTCVEMEDSLKKSELALKCEDKMKQFVTMKQLLKQLVIVETTANAMINEVPEKSLELKRTPLCSRVLNQPELLIDFSEDVRLYKTIGEADTVCRRVLSLEVYEYEKTRYTCIYRGPSELVFSDNSSISIHDTMRNQTKQMSFPVKISAIAVEKDKIFIALQDQGLVVTPGENDKMITVLTTVEPCVGIIKSSNMFYVTVVSNHAGQLREYTLNGSLNNVLKTNDKGKNIFTGCIGEVKISKQEMKLYVVDRNAGVVIASAATFKILKIISNLNSPKGISLVDDMSLFVLFETGEVRQTIDEGETWNIVFKKEPEPEPKGRMRGSTREKTIYHSICWDGYSSMYVSCISGKCLKVMQYRLEFSHM
ncbi:uncharacterized protein LOC123557031 [Mercenaria mercenaria]|uniref:uncharacterized protein LOC123557031 n=1 Tax=Mercenaria mercenaria TaxID=6596 RepID=UPI00234E6296|nr:uncharacterized protein LOC123557031 [Mercenaria mercenaria]